MGASAALDCDAELMLRVKDGDGASFALLLGKYRASVNHFLYRMVQDRAIAEELAQEVFLRVYRSRETYEPTAKLTTWLYRNATHVALKWLATKRMRAPWRGWETGEDTTARDVQDRSPTVEQKLLHQVNVDEVRQAVAALPDKQRAAVLMHKYDEMEYSQIAKVLSCSESAVKSLLFRAYETLRVRLAHMA